MEETFTAGVEPGGLTEGREIRILVCHILAGVQEPMSFDELTESILAYGSANYFEFASALSELENTGCVISFKTETGIGEYTITDKGRAAAKTLQSDLPLSVRDKVIEAALNVIQRRRIEKENLVSITRTEDGFKIHMSVTDIGTDLMELSLFMPTQKQALAVKERFLSDPAGTYMNVLEALAGDVGDF